MNDYEMARQELGRDPVGDSYQSYAPGTRLDAQLAQEAYYDSTLPTSVLTGQLQTIDQNTMSTSGLIPSANDTYPLGSTDRKYTAVYADRIFTGESSVQTINSDHNVTLNDGILLVDASAGVVHINLMTPATAFDTTSKDSLRLVVKKIDNTGNAVILIGTVDNATNYSLTLQNQKVTVASNGAGYYTIAT